MTAPALPMLELGPLEVQVIPDASLATNQVVLRATQQVRFRQDETVQYGDGWTSLVLGAIRGTIHGRTNARRAFHVSQSDEAWDDELIEALGDVLAADDSNARRQALLDLAAIATEGVIANDYARITSKET